MKLAEISVICIRENTGSVYASRKSLVIFLESASVPRIILSNLILLGEFRVHKLSILDYLFQTI